MFKLVLEKAEEPEIKLPTSAGSWKKQESSRETSISALLILPRPLAVWVKQTGKFWKRWKYQTTLLASWEICMQVKKQQLEPDMEQWTGSKSGKEYIKAVYCHPAYLIYVHGAFWETLDWKKYKLESRLPGEISITEICRWHHPYGRKWRGTKEPLDEGERGEWKSWHKTQHSENEDHGIRSHHFMANRETKETVTDFLFLGSKITADVDCSHEIKRKAMTNLDSMLKSRDITLPTKVCLVSYHFSSSQSHMDLRVGI